MSCRESFSIRNLSNCNVFLLDYTSEVEVTNCNNCRIFIGPVDGPAIFNGNSDCDVAVACQQFQAKGTHNTRFSLYCATAPSLSNCSGIALSCWNGSYPGLDRHFHSANLDPTKNQWFNVYDASAFEGNSPNFELSMVESSQWEVPIEGSLESLENPVPFSAPMQASDLLSEDNFGTRAVNETLENGGEKASISASAQAMAPSMTTVHERIQQRLASQAKEEAEKRAELQSAAAQYLEEFYAKRKEMKEKRVSSSDPSSGGDLATIGPKGATVWERAVSLIDFNMARPNGTDLSRFKGVLMSCTKQSTTET